ncbi:uncharacterized protein LOC144434861 [Glandiceps talaboti]
MSCKKWKYANLQGTTALPKRSSLFVPFIDEFVQKFVSLTKNESCSTTELHRRYKLWLQTYTTDAKLLALSEQPRLFAKAMRKIACKEGWSIYTHGLRGYGVRCTAPARERSIRSNNLIVVPVQQEVVDTYLSSPPDSRHLPFNCFIINKRVGYGAFANRKIEPGDIIAECFGEVLFGEQSYREREAEYKHMGRTSFFFAFRHDGRKAYFDSNRFPDGRLIEKNGNPGCMLNHSNKCNTEVRKFVKGGLPRLLVISCCRIAPGTELTYNYSASVHTNGPYVVLNGPIEFMERPDKHNIV